MDQQPGCFSWKTWEQVCPELAGNRGLESSIPTAPCSARSGGCRSTDQVWFGTCRWCPGAAQHSQVCSVHVLADSLCLTWPQGALLSSSHFSRENTLPRWAQQHRGLYIHFFHCYFSFAPFLCHVLDFNFLLLHGRGQLEPWEQMFLMLIFVWALEWRSRLCFFSPPCSGLLVVQSIMQLFHASCFVLIKVVEEIV